MFLRQYSLFFLLAGAALVTTSCGDDDDDKVIPAVPATLYERLGKAPAITAVVDDFIGRVVAETGRTPSNLKRTFQPLLTAVGTGDTYRVTLLRNNLIDQIGEAAGGPLIYKGKSMKLAHKDMNITLPEFTALVVQLDSALIDNGVPKAERDELVGVLGGLRPDIVGQ